MGLIRRRGPRDEHTNFFGDTVDSACTNSTAKTDQLARGARELAVEYGAERKAIAEAPRRRRCRRSKWR
jgi:hypothetical protein